MPQQRTQTVPNSLDLIIDRNNYINRRAPGHPRGNRLHPPSLIQNRNVSTQLSLTDGQTLVIGGLISENRSSNDTGIPYLKDIPGVGQFFRNQSVSKDRTELLVFITPYVISSDADAAALTNQFQEKLKGWNIPEGTLRW